VTITNGRSLGKISEEDGLCPDESGGGIRINGGTLTVRSVTLTNNVSTCGGSIAVLVPGNLNVTDSTVSDSSSVDGSAGGIFIRSGSTVAVDNGTFVNNKSDDGGGAIRNNAFLSITNSQFRNNSSIGGGAISNSGQVKISGSIFQGNLSFKINNSTGFGGAIINNGQVDIIGGSFSQNSAQKSGGAIAQDSTGKMTISNVETTSNSSDGTRGGIFNAGSILTLTNNTFVPANTPDDVRGGLGGGTGSGNNPAACSTGVCP
jgi:predicted outer membrane repeat protein